MIASNIWLFRLGLLVCWLLLNGLSPSHFLLGLVIALLIPIPIERSEPPRKHAAPWRLLASARLLASLLLDMLMSGWSMIRQVCSPHLHNRPGWLSLPLTVDNHYARTILASCISLTPGTISVEVDDELNVLLMHCLHVDDADQTLQQIHARYQRPLEELFA